MREREAAMRRSRERAKEDQAVSTAWSIRAVAGAVVLSFAPADFRDPQSAGEALLVLLVAGLAFAGADAVRDRVIADRAARAVRGDDRVCDACGAQRPAERFPLRWEDLHPPPMICDVCAGEEDEIERAFDPRGQSLRGLSPTDPRSDHHAD